MIYNGASSSFTPRSVDHSDGCFGSHLRRVSPNSWPSYKSFQKPGRIIPGAPISSSSHLQVADRRTQDPLFTAGQQKQCSSNKQGSNKHIAVHPNKGFALGRGNFTGASSTIPLQSSPSHEISYGWDGIPSSFSFLAVLHIPLIIPLMLEQNKQDMEGCIMLLIFLYVAREGLLRVLSINTTV